MASLPKAPAGAPRLPGLDLLRAAAISWVMLYHLSLFELAPYGWWIVRFGWMGVDLFFVLSGFLIAGQLLRPWAQGERPDFRRFFFRRLLRTLPAFWVVLAVYVLVPAVREKPHLQPVWTFYSFTFNLVLGSEPNAFSHAWSLCVEEQFYLSLPIVLALLAVRPGPRKAVAAMLAVLLLGMALRAWLWRHEIAPAPLGTGARAIGYMRWIYYPTFSRLDGLLFGAAAAALKLFRPPLWTAVTRRPNLLLGAGIAGVAVSTLFFKDQIAGFWPAVFGYPMLALSLALMVMAASEARCVIGGRAVPGAGALAAGSYSLYLSHKMVFHAVGAGLLAHPALLHSAGPFLAVATALPAGAALYWAVERPFLRLRDRLRRPGRAAMAPAPAVP